MCDIDIDMFLEGAELEGDMEVTDEQYASDFIGEEKPAAAMGVQGEGLGPQKVGPKKIMSAAGGGAGKKPINLVT